MANNDRDIWIGGSPEWAAYYSSQGKLPVPGSQEQSNPKNLLLPENRPTAYTGDHPTGYRDWKPIEMGLEPAPAPKPVKPTTPLNLMDLVAKYPKLKENPQEMAQLWMADAVKYFPNIGNAYMESANAATDNYNKQYGSLEQIFNALGPQLNTLMQQQQGEYSGIANNMAQIPQYALDKFAELGITADHYNNAVQQAAAGNYENINAIKGIVNNAGLDFNALTASTTEQYDALRDQSGRLNQSQQDIYNQLQQYLTDYSNKTGQSSDAISSNQEFLKNLLTKSGIDFEGALSDQRDAYGNLTDQSQQTGQKQQDLAAQLQQYLTDYTNKSDQTSAGLGGTQDFLKNLLTKSGIDFEGALSDQRDAYGNLIDQSQQTGQKQQDLAAQLQQYLTDYSNKTGQSSDAISSNQEFLKNLLTKSGIDFEGALSDQRDAYGNLTDQSQQTGQKQQDLAAQLQQYLTDYTNKSDQTSAGLGGTQDFLKNLLQQSGINFENLIGQQQGEYAGFKGEGEGLQAGAAGAYQGIQDKTGDIWQQMWDAQQATKTGQLDPRTQAYIDQIYSANESLLDQSLNETISDQRKQLIDQMAGRGILSSGVTGRAYGEMLDSALRQKQKGMTEILKERAQTSLGMPFQQAEAANKLLQYTDQAKNLTQVERQQLLDTLQTRYNMSKENAQTALQNLTSGTQVGISGAGQQQQGYQIDAATQKAVMEQASKMTADQSNNLINMLQTNANMTREQATLAIQNLTSSGQMGISGATAQQQGIQVDNAAQQALMDAARGMSQDQVNGMINALQTNANMTRDQATLVLQNLTSGTQAGISGAGQQQQGYQIDAATQKAVMEQASKMTADQSNNLINMLQTNANMTREQATLAIQNLTSSGQMGISGATAQQQGIQVDNAAQQALMDAARGMSQDQVNGMINALQTNANMTRDQAAAAVQTLTSKNQAQLQGSQQVQTGLAQTPEMMNQMINTMKGLTESELNSVVNTLQTQYNMSHQNAQLALQNLMQGNTAMLQTIAQQGATNAAPMDMWSKMFDQYGALGSHFVDQLVQQYESALDRQAQIDAARAGKSSGSSGSGLLGSIIGSICVREDSLITMLDGKLKPANSIKVGDKILGYDVKLNTYIPQIIKETYISEFKHYYRITLANDTKLYTSEYHPCLISKKGKKIWAVNNYYNAVKNIVKRVLRKPWSVFTNFKWLWKATVNYTNMKVGQNMVLDKNNNTSQIMKIETIVDKAKFCNFKTTEYKKSTFIANGVVVEGLNDWTGTFMEWVEKSGNYPKVKGE